ncbi:MAG: hypothetical protein ACRDGV_04640 [Candidatus Limnocylindria bacterium]
MSSRIRAHIHSNIYGILALFFALTMGTAWATHPGGANTISSEDVIDEEIRTWDIRDGHVRTTDLQNGAVNRDKLAKGAVVREKVNNGAVNTDKLANDAVNSAKVADGSLTGFDIDESTLGQVPAAAFAFEANTAFDAERLDGLDSPELMTPSRYAQETAPVGLTSTGQEVLTTAIPMTGFRRLMATATVRADGGGGNDDVISCIIVIDGSASLSYPEAIPDMTPDFADVQTLSLSFARDVGAGTKDVALRCHAAHGTVVVQDRSLLVWAVDRS